MKITANKWMIVFIAGWIMMQGIHQVKAQKMPTSKSILKKMTVANKYFMKKWNKPGAPIVHPDRTRPSNLWTRATYLEGLIALHSIDPKKKYYKYGVKWGESHDWKPTYGNMNTKDADHYCCGQTYIDLYYLDTKPERIKHIKTTIDNVMAREENDDWHWIDAIQMGMPVFAKLGVLLEEPKYLDKMHAMYMHSKTQLGENGLYNPEDGLWWRDADFDPPYTEPNGEDCYWSRGNGWVIAALARVLDILPEDGPNRKEYITTLKEMSEALIKVQREDGFWNVSLHDPDNYGGPETSGTAFFVYGMAWGINNGYLDAETYKPAVIKGWNALADKALHKNGFLGFVQGTGKEPADGQPVAWDHEPNFDDFGLGAFLLAGSEMYKMAKASEIKM